MAEPVRVSIVGGSGYTGGELLRLLLAHPRVRVQQVTSRTLAGKSVGKAHPNLRKVADLKFSHPDSLEPCDVLCLCLPHGEAMAAIDGYTALAPRLIDLSADFRLRSAELYERWYHRPHARPDLLGRFVYGIPELHRDAMREARWVSSAGCNATATILALWPLYRVGVVEPDRTVVEVKVGSSEAGNRPTPGSHHPERAGCVRSFMPTGHRHTAEIVQELRVQSSELRVNGGALSGRETGTSGLATLSSELATLNSEFATPEGALNSELATNPSIHFSATALDLVRGALATCHVFLREDLSEKDIWKIYRDAYAAEPFIRIVKERDGQYRYPEPKLLAGTNFCDIGFERDPHGRRVVVISAIDNLMKGAAGQAVQAMNIMHGWDERTGLEFAGLHP